jgi:hypothetical protein
MVTNDQWEALITASLQWSWELTPHEFLPQRRHDLGCGHDLGQTTGETVVLLRSDGLL